MPRLTPHEIHSYEKAGRFPKPLKEQNPTLHFCKEWDFMLIDKTDPEFEACLCDELEH